jgi:hypothetical protein
MRNTEEGSDVPDGGRGTLRGSSARAPVGAASNPVANPVVGGDGDDAPWAANDEDEDAEELAEAGAGAEGPRTVERWMAPTTEGP